MVIRYDMEYGINKFFSQEAQVIPVQSSEGAWVSFEDYAALAAQVEVLGDKLSEVVALLDVDGMTAVQWLLDNCQEIESLTNTEPQQHLAEIRAQAVIEFASFIYRQFENGEYHRLARHKFQQLNSRAQGQIASIHNDVEYCGILGNAEFYAAKVQQGGE